jgi:hypothetical protein
MGRHGSQDDLLNGAHRGSFIANLDFNNTLANSSEILK